jgi:hypothetical protein
MFSDNSDLKTTDPLLEKEAYNEQMWEQRANGIPTVSFEEWKRRNEARRQFFANWNSAKADAEARAEAYAS